MNRGRLESYIHRLIRKQIFPGITLVVADHHGVKWEQTTGWKSIFPEAEVLLPETIYDLASLTKPLVTAFLILYFHDREKLAIDSPVTRYWPECPFPVTIRQLLVHSGGLPAWHPFYLYYPSGPIPDAVFSTVPIAYRPGSQILYSCVGYMILAKLLERISGSRLPNLAKVVMIDPLKLERTFFQVPPELIRDTAPTETANLYERELCRKFDPAETASFVWRSGVIRGTAHDLNAFHFAGSTGNAGLFSTARDLLALSVEFYPETARILKPETAAWFWSNQTAGFRTHRSFGFKLNSSLLTSGGSAIAPDAIGHNGFTGTSIWMERQSGFRWLILTNRVHPKVLPVQMDRIRRRIHKLTRVEID